MSKAFEETSQIMLIEDDDAYSNTVADYFDQHPSPYRFDLIRTDNLNQAVELITKHDFKVVIVDLSLSEGQFGTDSIDAIWRIDKKVIFIIHSILSVEKVHAWLSTYSLPYTSRFYLQKSGFTVDEMKSDAQRLYDLVVTAIKCYVPHFEPTLVSVKDDVNAVEEFWSRNKSFNRAPVIANMHYSQDVINRASRWSSDKLSRPGFDTTRICAVVVGSLARLEGGPSSDADYFLVFDDEGLAPDDVEELQNAAYRAFVRLGSWFQTQGVPIHDFETAERKPENIDWHRTTLPTWFPLSSLCKKRLGFDSQIELSNFGYS